MNGGKPEFLIAWIDHEDYKFEIIKKLQKRIVTHGAMNPLEDYCEFIYITIPSTDINVPEMVAYILDEIRKYRAPDLFFIDLNFGESKTSYDGITAADKGFELAGALSQAISPTPVGLFTAVGAGGYYKVKASILDFAIILYDINNLVEDSITGLTGDDWYYLFSLAISERKKKNDNSLNFLSINNKVLWKDGHPINRSLSFEKIAPHLTERALAWLDPPPEYITISQLSGGFSGAFVVKAELPGRQAAFVIKIDEDPAKLIKELEGYRRVESLLDFQYYLKIPSQNGLNPIKLTDYWWAAFPMVFDGRSQPLIKCSDPGEDFYLDDDTLAEVYERLWSQCLFNLYGNCELKTFSVHDIIEEKFFQILSDGWDGLKRYQKRFNTVYTLNDIDVLKLTDRLKTLRAFIIDIPLVERVHGDLNCRNILYENKSDEFRLIDFPHVGPPDCLAIDFVKAEAELVLIMMDWGTGKDCDFDRIAVWTKLVHRISSNLLITTNGFDDDVARVILSIEKIRSTFQKKTEDLGDFSRCYQFYLLARLLRYVNYSDLTIPKRFLIYIWIKELLNKEW